MVLEAVANNLNTPSGSLEKNIIRITLTNYLLYLRLQDTLFGPALTAILLTKFVLLHNPVALWFQ